MCIYILCRVVVGTACSFIDVSLTLSFADGTPEKSGRSKDGQVSLEKNVETIENVRNSIKKHGEYGGGGGRR